MSIPSILLCLLLMTVRTVHAQQSAQQAYALNDPRNPDCPCHKLQKQAEEEYAKQQKKTGGEVQPEVNTVAGSHQTSASGNHVKRKRKGERMRDLQFRLGRRRTVMKKGKREVALCYRW